jgi:hypothetical protein
MPDISVSKNIAMAVENPYASPEAPPAGPHSGASHSSGYFVDGNLLVARDGAILPSRCIKTNLPIGPVDWTSTKKLTWTPPWVWLLILVSPVVLAIVAVIVQKKAKVTISMARPIRSKQVKQSAFGWCGAALGVAILWFSCLQDQDWIAWGIGGGILLILVGLVFVSIPSSMLRVTKFKDGWFSIKGCSPEFLNALAAPNPTDLGT